jgi:L-threonylcarbamoyladenylate synthase
VPTVPTRIVPVVPTRISPEIIAEAAGILRAGGLVAFPTETVYGLGANALDAAAVARIYQAKGRPAGNPLIVHIADVAAARPLVSVWPAAAQKLAERFWPGPLTLVLPRTLAVPDIVTGGGPTVGVRVPAQPIALALLEAAGVPVAAPSANRSNYLSPTTAQHVLRDLSGRVDLILDGGPTRSGIESTVLDLSTDPPRILRPGPIQASELAACVGLLATAQSAHASAQDPLPAPGMLTRHYAPRARVWLASDSGERDVQRLVAAGHHVGWITFDRAQPNARLLAIVMPSHATEYAARLYAVLHELDDAGVDSIVVAAVPDEPAWTAIRDRLQRGATG